MGPRGVLLTCGSANFGIPTANSQQRGWKPTRTHEHLPVAMMTLRRSPCCYSRSPQLHDNVQRPPALLKRDNVKGCKPAQISICPEGILTSLWLASVDLDFEPNGVLTIRRGRSGLNRSNPTASGPIYKFSATALARGTK